MKDHTTPLQEDLLFCIRQLREVSGAADYLRSELDSQEEQTSSIQLLTARVDELENTEQRLRFENQDLRMQLRATAEVNNTLGLLRDQGIFTRDTLQPFHLHAGKISTIRAVRELTNLSLKEAKDLVEQWIETGAGNQPLQFDGNVED